LAKNYQQFFRLRSALVRWLAVAEELDLVVKAELDWL
jgi:hypothetical protein